MTFCSQVLLIGNIVDKPPTEIHRSAIFKEQGINERNRLGFLSVVPSNNRILHTDTDATRSVVLVLSVQYYYCAL